MITISRESGGGGREPKNGLRIHWAVAIAMVKSSLLAVGTTG